MPRVSFSIVFVFILTLFPVIVNTAPLAARASGSSGCYQCPPQDNLGFALGDHSDADGKLFCSYPTSPNEDPNVFFCRYNDATGTLVEDHDAGLCPGTAVNVCSSKRSIVGALKRRIEARAAQPKSSQPEYMAARYALGKKKRAD